MAIDTTLLEQAIDDSPGASIDKELLEELLANLELLDVSSQIGSSTFNGITGRAITITEMANTSYFVSITPSANPAGNLGEVWVINDSTTQFTVYCSGSAATAFKWQVST